MEAKGRRLHRSATPVLYGVAQAAAEAFPLAAPCALAAPPNNPVCALNCVLFMLWALAAAV